MTESGGAVLLKKEVTVDFSEEVEDDLEIEIGTPYGPIKVTRKANEPADKVIYTVPDELKVIREKHSVS